jgi:chromosome partitioning protein
VDLLSSSLDLIDVQDRLASAPTSQFYSATPVDLLRLSVKNQLDAYDIMLIKSQHHHAKTVSVSRKAI